jgi:acyl carrier protein
MTSDDVLTALRTALCESLEPGELADIDVDGITLDTPMLALALDSLGLMVVVDHLEANTTVRVPAEDVYQCTAVADLVNHILVRLQPAHA